jgi:hypothetical protein
MLWEHNPLYRFIRRLIDRRSNITPAGNRTRILRSFRRRHLFRISAAVTGLCLNFIQIINSKFYPCYPCQNLPRLSTPNIIQITHAKFYLGYPCQNLPILLKPNLTLIIHAKFEVSYFNRPWYLFFRVPCTAMLCFYRCTSVQLVHSPVACGVFTRAVERQEWCRVLQGKEIVTCAVSLHRDLLNGKIVLFVVINLRPVTRRI